jgi:hypothetical protein
MASAPNPNDSYGHHVNIDAVVSPSTTHSGPEKPSVEVPEDHRLTSENQRKGFFFFVQVGSFGGKKRENFRKMTEYLGANGFKFVPTANMWILHSSVSSDFNELKTNLTGLWMLVDPFSDQKATPIPEMYLPTDGAIRFAKEILATEDGVGGYEFASHVTDHERRLAHLNSLFGKQGRLLMKATKIVKDQIRSQMTSQKDVDIESGSNTTDPSHTLPATPVKQKRTRPIPIATPAKANSTKADTDDEKSTKRVLSIATMPRRKKRKSSAHRSTSKRTTQI